jgi:hypothetical protein
MALKADRFQIIDKLREKFPLAWFLRIGDVSKAGYWRSTNPIRRVRFEENM